MIYLDVNIFLYPILYEEDKIVKKCKDILIQIVSGKLNACTSWLSWDEFVWVLSKTLGRKIAIEEGRKFIVFPNLKWIEVNESIILKAQRLVEELGFKPRDSIHLASAILHSNKLITLDKEFKKAKKVIDVEILE
jgi:predicted nucleic acid-binding protein